MAKVITYDLVTPGKDYSSLITAIKEYPNWVKINESCWVISASETCPTIRNDLMQHIDANDRLFVAALTGESAWAKTICKDENLKTILHQ